MEQISTLSAEYLFLTFNKQAMIFILPSTNEIKILDHQQNLLWITLHLVLE